MFGGLSQLTEGLKKNWDRLEATMDTAVGATKTPSVTSSISTASTTAATRPARDHMKPSTSHAVPPVPQSKSGAGDSFWSAWSSSPAAPGKSRSREEEEEEEEEEEDDDDDDDEKAEAAPVKAVATPPSSAALPAPSQSSPSNDTVWSNPTPVTSSMPTIGPGSENGTASAADADADADAPGEHTTAIPVANQDVARAAATGANKSPLKEEVATRPSKITAPLKTKGVKQTAPLPTPTNNTSSRSPTSVDSPGGSSLDASQLRSKLKLAIRKLKEGRLKQTRAEERIAVLEARVNQLEQQEQQEHEQREQGQQQEQQPDTETSATSAASPPPVSNSPDTEDTTSIIATLRTKLTALRTTRDELEHRVISLTGQLERLQQQYAEERRQSEAAFARTLALETTRRTTDVSSLTSAIAEKDATILALRDEVAQRDTKVAAIIEEGMGWSRREEKQSRMNKKLRERLLASEDENAQVAHQADALRASVASLETQIAAAQAETHTLKAKLKEALSKVSKLPAVEVKVATLEAALRKERELAADRSSRISELESADELAKTQGVAIEEGDARVAALKADLAEARATLTHVREDAAVVEDRLQHELKALHNKWQQAETRNEELGEQVSSSSRPLLRQISALQNLLEEQRSVWQASEAALTQRAVRAETNSVRAAEQQSAATTDTQTMRLALARCEEKLHMAEAAREAALETAATRAAELKKELAAKTAAVQEAEQALQCAEAQWERERKTAAARRADEAKAQAEMSREIQVLTRRLEKERARGEQACAELAAFTVKREGMKNQTSGDAVTSTAKQGIPSLEDHKSTVDLMLGAGAAAVGVRIGGVGIGGGVRRDIGGGAGGSGGSAISSFHATRQVRAQESSWRARCLEAEASRENLAAKLCELGTMETKYNALCEEHGQVLQKQETLLVMLGEKADRVEELESDIVEVKRVYRQLAEREFAAAAGE